jgi:hypothetical protein
MAPHHVIAEGVSDLCFKRADYTSYLKKKGFEALLCKLNKKMQQYAGSRHFFSPASPRLWWKILTANLSANFPNEHSRLQSRMQVGIFFEALLVAQIPLRNTISRKIAAHRLTSGRHVWLTWEKL